ncbi:hypothetical protein MACH26_01310 [Planctobacterium marinum]|uniref:MOSC domain-containing protein n=2 Tax=Planctobacterium marinum TaxID=1631968 RepID=A0AA48KSQ9_9ALTE|nr:hypothetical protein MACH26_01310 [Planctobacterium marinum]
MVALDHDYLEPGKGLCRDRFKGSEKSRRQVSIIQAEHISAVAQMLGKSRLAPELFRRNIVVSGINLLALKNARFYLGTALLEMSGLCHPCSRMEEALGQGGYNLMRGHGGILARVISPGEVHLGDSLRYVESL